MSEEDGEAAELIVVFHLFLITLAGAFISQIGGKIGLKYPAGILYFSGMLVGFYFIQFPRHRIVVLDYLGSSLLRSAYTPLYFFVGTFKLETEFIQIRKLPHAIACVLVLVSTTYTVPIVSSYFFDFAGNIYNIIFMTIIIITPDLRTTRHFLEATSHNFSSKELFILLELESLIGSIFASLAHDLLVDRTRLHSFEIITFILRNIFTCLFAFFVGKFTAASINRMHYDNLNQLTALFTSLYFTYALATTIESSGDLAVVTLGIVLLRAKPRMTPETVSNMNRFVEIFRYALGSSILIVAGILFTMSVYFTFTKRILSIIGVIYLIIVGYRFVIILGFWVVFRKIYQLKLIAILTVCAVNIKSIFNIVLAFDLINDVPHFLPEPNELFIIVNSQVFMSFILTTAIASFMLNIEGQRTVNLDQSFMARRALERINESKETTIKVLRGIQLTVDADWSNVCQATAIESSYFKRFAHRVDMKQMDNSSHVSDISRMRSNAIKDLLRLQKRFFEEQFRHGTLEGRSAKRFAYFLRRCMHKSMFMSAQQVIDKTRPNAIIQIIIRDLIRALNMRKKTSTLWLIVAITMFTFDVYLNFFNAFSKIFMYSNINQLTPLFSTSYNLVLGILGIYTIFKTGSYYLHSVSYNLWNWLAWAFALLSFWAFVLEFLSLNLVVKNREYQISTNDKFDVELKVYYFITLLTSVIILLRSLTLACTLHPVQYFMFRVASTMLNALIHTQCDGCQGFLQVMVDTHQRLENRAINPVFEAGASDLLHQQGLAMRQFLGVMEVLTPDVMTALKTRLACRLVLMSQEKIIRDLDEDGKLESNEIDLLTNILRNKILYLRNLKTTLTEPSVTEIIRNIPWVAMTDSVQYQDIVNAGVILNFHPGDELLHQGVKVSGLLVVLRGLIRVEIASFFKKTGKQVMRKYRKSRYIIGRSSSSSVDAMDKSVELSDFYTRGNVMGEYPFLTDKPCHKTFRCVTEVKVLYLPKEIVKSFMRGISTSVESLNLLEYNMWTTVAIRQAARLIQWSASYHLLTRRQLYIMMEDSYIMGCEEYGEVELQNLHRAAVVLIYGELSCPSTDQIYQGPAIIPSSLVHLYARRPGAVHEYLEPHKNIILILRSFREMRLSKTRTPLIESEASQPNLGENESLLTVSSGSSDGIPYRHK